MTEKDLEKKVTEFGKAENLEDRVAELEDLVGRYSALLINLNRRVEVLENAVREASWEPDSAEIISHMEMHGGSWVEAIKTLIEEHENEENPAR